VLADPEGCVSYRSSVYPPCVLAEPGRFAWCGTAYPDPLMHLARLTWSQGRVHHPFQMHEMLRASEGRVPQRVSEGVCVYL